MKIAYSNLACPDWSLEQVMQFAARTGYDGVEIRLVDGNVIPADLADNVRRQIVALAKEYGVEVMGIGASTRFSMANPEERAHNVHALLQYLELAADMGIPMVRSFGGGPTPGQVIPVSDLIARVAEGLNQVAQRARELGVEVLLETHDEFSSSSLVRDVLSRVEERMIGALWDTHHPHRMGESPVDTYSRLQDRLRHVHVKDARRTDGGWELVPLGEGEVPVGEVVSVLVQHGYDHYLTVEWERKWHPEIAPAEKVLPHELARIQEYLRMARG